MTHWPSKNNGVDQTWRLIADCPKQPRRPMPCRSASRAPADSPKMKSLHLGDPKLRCEFGAAQFFSQCHDVNISKCSFFGWWLQLVWQNIVVIVIPNGAAKCCKNNFEATRKQKKNECQMMKNYILNTPAGTIRFISGVHSKTDSGPWNNLEAHGTCGKPNNHPQLRPYQPFGATKSSQIAVCPVCPIVTGPVALGFRA